jgi:hypothetical protein
MHVYGGLPGCPLRYEGSNVIIARGERLVTTPARWAVIKVLIDSYPRRLLFDELQQRSGKGDAGKHLAALCKEHPVLAAHISTPGGAKGVGFAIV